MRGNKKIILITCLVSCLLLTILLFESALKSELFKVGISALMIFTAIFSSIYLTKIRKEKR